MDPEQTFLRVHARLSGMLSQLLAPRIRMALEYAYLAVAISLLAVLVVMHTNFVQQPGCSSELSGIELSDAQLVRIKITGAGLWTRSSFGQNTMDAHGVVTETSKGPELHGDGLAVLSAKFWSHWLGLGARRGKLSLKSWRTDKEYLEPQVEKLPESTISKPYEADSKSEFEVQHDGRPSSLKGALKVAFHHLYSNWNMPIMSFWSNTKEFFGFVNQMWKRAGWNVFADAVKSLRLLRWEHFKSSAVKWLEKRSQSFEPTYLYTVEKGYFLLPEGAKSQHSIRTVNITISAQNSCFGNRWQQLLINSLVGYDTILMNSLLDSPGHGYLYNYQTKEFYDLSYGQELPEGSARFGDYFVTKCGVLLMSLFVFFTTTMSVSFTLRETQSRMLKFTVQLQHHARNHLPTFQLIFVHVIESLVFVPIMIGILFFLFEFYDDQILAFLILTLVWLCELFTMISVRTAISMQFFPRFFLLYFLVFHIYFFSYRYGFSYLAFSTTAAFMLHLILYFWNRFEVPALHRFMRTRAQLQQQTGVHFTSSTFYASTLHIARLSMANANVVVNEPTIRTETLSRVNAPRGSDTTGQFQGSGSQDVSSLNPQRAGISGSSTMSNIGSLLLWLLGGTSEGIGSFFSMSRDVRDQVGQVHTEQNQEGNVSR